MTRTMLWYSLGLIVIGALLVPVLTGLIAAYLVPPGAHESRPAACGGSVTLALGLLFIAGSALLRRRQGVTELT